MLTITQDSYRQFNYKLRIRTLDAIHPDVSVMSFYDVITQTQPQTGSLAGGFGGKKGLEDFIC